MASSRHAGGDDLRWEKGARPVDRFAWLTLATMVLDKMSSQTVTRDVVRATLTPKTFPKVVKVA